MKRIALTILVVASLVAACDRIVELSPPPDGAGFDGVMDGQPVGDAGDGGVIDVPDANGDGGVGDGGAPAD